MKISLITPCLNSADVLANCIESVQSQSLSCEHILIDGGSTDETLDLVARHDRHFAQVISELDTGIYAAMNKGIGLATGDVIGILNSDDHYADDDVLRDVQQVFQDPAVSACYGDLEYVSAGAVLKVTRRWVSGDLDRSKFLNGWMPPHPTLFVRKSVYNDFGVFREDLGTSADYEFMLRIFLKHGLNAEYLPRVLVRMRAGGASNHSLAARWQANRNDVLAWKVNDLNPKPWTLVAKPLRKVAQWWVR